MPQKGLQSPASLSGPAEVAECTEKSNLSPLSSRKSSEVALKRLVLEVLVPMSKGRTPAPVPAQDCLKLGDIGKAVPGTLHILTP